MLSVPITWVNTMKQYEAAIRAGEFVFFQSPLPGSIQWNQTSVFHTRPCKYLSVPITWVNTMKPVSIIDIFSIAYIFQSPLPGSIQWNRQASAFPWWSGLFCFQSPLPGSIQWNRPRFRRERQTSRLSVPITWVNTMKPGRLQGDEFRSISFSPHYLGQYNETLLQKCGARHRGRAFSPHYLGQYNETWTYIQKAWG